MTREEKLNIRMKIQVELKALLGTLYLRGAEWTDFSIAPTHLDCSELVEVVFRKLGLMMPDGAANQYAFLKSYEVSSPHPGDVGFFIESENGDPGRPLGTVYHSGVVYDDHTVIEARGKPYNKVITRPLIVWNQWKNFGGWFEHPELAL